MVVTRWSKIDLPGQVLRKSIESGDDWKIIELPAILDEHTDKERPVWPEFWDLEELKKTRDTLPVAKWSAQWQQKPTSEEGAIVKREWWKRWEHKRPPDCEMIIQSWDTALTTKDYSDFSACTTWGIFYNEDGVANIMLLDAYKGRLEFPDLKDMAMKLYKERQPEAFIIEAKAAGQPLVSEFRRMGIPVHEYVPARGARGQSNDKLARLNSVSDLFRSGHVWAPADKNWADMVIEEMAEFPYGEHDDLVDATVMALMRFREGGFISLNSDDPWKERVAKRVFNYY